MSQVATPREAQVLAFREQGLTLKQTALELGISTGTVKIHTKNLFAKGLAHPKPRPGAWKASKLDALLAQMEYSLSLSDSSQPVTERWTKELLECKS